MRRSGTIRAENIARLTVAAGILGLMLPFAGESLAAATSPVIAESPWPIYILSGIGILMGFIGFAVVLAAMLLKAAGPRLLAHSATNLRVQELEKELGAVKSLLMAEPQLLLDLSSGGASGSVEALPGGAPLGRIVANTLDATVPLPERAETVLDVLGWCPADVAQGLSCKVEALWRKGTPFNQVVNLPGSNGGKDAATTLGTPIDIDGWTAGGRAYLRFRPVRSYDEELAGVLAQRDKGRRIIVAMRTLFDVLPMPVWFKDPKGMVSWVNQSYLAMVGAQSRDQVKEDQIDFLEERQRGEVAQAIDAGRVFQEKLRVVTEGNLRTFDTIAVPSPGGGHATIAVDVEAIETARGNLDRQMQGHTRTLERLTTAVAIFAADQKLAFYNQAYIELWGFEQSWLETHPEHGQILDKLRAQGDLPEQTDYTKWKTKILKHDGRENERERWWHLPDGRTILVMVEYTEDGGNTVLYENVTEQVALQKGYNELINVQRETLDHLRDGVAVFAMSGRLRLFNPAFAEMWKLDIAQLEAEPHIEEVIKACSPLFADAKVWGGIKAAITAIEDSRSSIGGQFTRTDGRILNYSGLPLPDGAMMLTLADVTQVELAERSLIEKNEALENADKVKSGFISNVSYELRTPLTNIIGFSDMLMNPVFGELTAKQREYMEDIRSSSATLLAIINDILDLATLDAGALELNLSEVRAMPAIEAAVLGVRERLVRDKIALEIHVQPEDLEFVADGQRLTQVFYNLLSNAIGFSPSGGTIEVHCYRVPEGVRFEVIDHGRGIPEAYRKQVFDRFESDSRGARHRGAGLGLSIVKDLVELHGGEVALRSSEGEGTAVRITLPETGRRPAAQGGSAAGESPTGRRPSLKVV